MEALGLMKASFRSLVMEGGSGWPFHLWSSGLGSKRSIWLGAPSMKQEDHVLRLRREMRLPGRQRVGRLGPIAVTIQQVRESDGADSTRASGGRNSPCLRLCQMEVLFVHRYSRVMNSSRFISTLATAVQAARSVWLRWPAAKAASAAASFGCAVKIWVC